MGSFQPWRKRMDTKAQRHLWSPFLPSLLEPMRHRVQELVSQVHVGRAHSEIHEAPTAELDVDERHVLRVHEPTSSDRFVR